jgi:drug/metabolite transporter (DMT)-like permease
LSGGAFALWAALRRGAAALSYLLLAFLSTLWGSSFLLIAIAARGFYPLGFAMVRVAIGALALWALAARGGFRWPRGLWARLCLMAAFGQAIPFLIVGDAAHRVSSGELALLMGVQPIFAFVLTRLLGQGGVWTPGAAFGLFCGLAGVAVAVGAPGAGDMTGRLEGLVAAMGYAFGATISRPASQQIGPAATAAASMTISFVALAAVWFVEDGDFAALAAAPPASLAAMAAWGIFNTALAYFVYFALVVREGATFAALNNYVVPFAGLALGAVFLGERVETRALVGLAMVVAGVALTGRAGYVFARRGGSGATRTSARPS